MKINVMKENNRVLATGSAYGRKIKAIAVCNEPEFDENVGIGIARRKYKIAEKEAQKKMHKSIKSDLKSIMAWCEKEMAHEDEILAQIDKAIEEKKTAHDEYLKSIFE